jgi:hemolysin activation/secretion protein
MDGTQSPYSVPSGVVLGVGIGAFFNLSEDNPAYQAFFSRIWGLGDYFAVNLIGEGATDFDNSWYVDGNLRFDLYPLPAYTVISPYLGVGAGIGWGTVTNEDEEALGVNLVGTVGFRLFKDLPVGLTFEANVDWYSTM